MKRKSLLFALLLALFMPWAANAQETVEIGTNGGTTNNSYLPGYTLYDNTLSEQIYTAEEVGMAGTISSIAFYNGGSTKSPTVTLYMVNTDQEAFSSTSDWLTVTSGDLVFEGSVTFTANEWTTIELDTPFEYDGTSNLGLVAHIHMNPYSSGLACRVFTSTDYCSMYKYRDNTVFDPTNPGVTGNRLGVKNQIILEITPAQQSDCETPTALIALDEPTDTEFSFAIEGGSGVYNIEVKEGSADWASYQQSYTGSTVEMSDLASNTSYRVRVQSVCDVEASGWAYLNFITKNPCAAPTNLQITDLTPESATLSWTAGYRETEWTVKYKMSTETEYREETVSGTPTLTLHDLASCTVYNVQVYNCRGENDPYLSGNFTTAAGIPLVEEFGTSIPAGWSMYTGMLNSNGTAAMNSATYGWSFGSNNGVFDNHARTNIYSNNQRWLVMPSVLMEDNMQLSFEVAYTAYSGTGAPAQNGTDDKFIVLVSTDNMATWTILRQWDNAGSEYVLNDLNPTPIAVSFDLSSYARQTVIVAFYGESTVSNADNNLHIDNVSIDYIPDCPKPTVLTVGDVTAHTAQLSWTSDANAWQICLNENEDNPIDVTTNPYSLENIADGTTYTVKVRANCGNDVYSEWSNEVSFTTLIACPAPTGLAASEITGHTAKLNWTGNSEGYNVYYRTMVSVEEGGLIQGFKTTTIPTGWSRYNTLLTDDVLNGTTALTTYNGGWSFGSANGVFDSHAKINIYSTSTKYWLVTPSVEVATNSTFDFDLALTKYSGTLQPVDPTSQLDDKFVVLISTDDMATWTILRQWDNAGSEYVYNNIACTANGEHVSFDLRAYVGQTVNIAFYGESTVSGGDNELHIDNVLVGIPVPAGEWNMVTAETAPCILTGLNPLTDYEAYVESICTGEQSHVTNVISFTTDVACPAPTGLTATNVGPYTADLSWTSGAEAWEIEVAYGTVAESSETLTANANPFTLTDLRPETEYSVRVRANCGDEGYSEWSSFTTFTTLEGCPVPEDVEVSDITYNSATVEWNGFNDSYVVSYRTAAGEGAPFKQNFENELGGWTFTSMNAANDINADGTNHAGILPIAAHSGEYGFRFSSYSSKTDDETYDQYLVSPELTVTGNLKFYFKKPNSSTENLYVGYSTTTNDLDAFTWTEDLVPTQEWQEYTQELASDVKYIAFHYFGDYKYYVYVDDITIGAYDIPVGEWETVEATESPVILTGLTPETPYEVKLQGFCGEMQTEETAIVTFTTLPYVTVTLDILGVGEDDWNSNSNSGYYLIASPMMDPITPSANNGFITDDFDLYYFNEEREGSEWRNYHVESFDIVPGKGYIYASKTDTQLQFTGVPNTNGEVTLQKTDGNTFEGWNLVGNPFNQTAYLPAGRTFYTMDYDQNLIVEVSQGDERNIEAMQAVFVVAENDGEIITFTTDAPEAKSAIVALNLNNRNGLIDRAIIRFDEGSTMPKLQLKRNSTKLYIPQDGNDYAVVRSEGMGAMPVNFKAESNGSYTITLSTEEVSFAYLHLIDKVANTDVDLLANPSYSFDALTTDFANRFELVFATSNGSEEDSFAFFSNGSFVINNSGDATLQVIDVNGRVLTSESINGCANVNVNAAAGVYMIRLVNGDNVKVQKVVVR